VAAGHLYQHFQKPEREQDYMQLQKHELKVHMNWTITVLVFLAFVSSAAQSQQPKNGKMNSEIKISARVSVTPSAGFRPLQQKTRNLTELVQEQNGQQMAYVTITTEQRRDHAEAIHRLLEIANETDGKPTFTEICGWPGLERVYTVRLAQVQAEAGEGELSEEAKAVAPEVQAVTIAVAESDAIVRFEGVLQPGAGPEGTIPILGLARGISCPANPHPEETKQAIDKLKQEPLRNSLGSLNTKPNELERSRGGAAGSGANSSPQITPVPGSGEGELQIALSKDGRYVVIGANSGIFVSSDFGDTFNAAKTPSAKNPIPFPNGGDPTLGTGANGAFYLGFVGFPDGTPAAGGVTGCADSVMASTDNGRNFKFVGHAALCPLTGNICLPDSPQMAVDDRNSTQSGDQLYMVWRNFPRSGVSQCTDMGGKYGYPTPTISCSVDGGHNWQYQATVGNGDFGRITVGMDGFVYVVYASGRNLMLNKFSSCATGLNTQSGFPVTIAQFVDVGCPPGLDRCGSRDAHGSVAVPLHAERGNGSLAGGRVSRVGRQQRRRLRGGFEDAAAQQRPSVAGFDGRDFQRDALGRF